MSMEEVIALIYEIQKIIESQKIQNKERVSSLEEAKETILQSFNKKSIEFDNLTEKFNELTQEYETLKSEKESILKDNEEKINSFREKTLGTVKLLVSRIEELSTSVSDKDKENSNLVSQVEELEKHLYDKNNEEKVDLSQYITLRKYNEDIAKIETEKQTALKNTWDEQKHLTSELEDKEKIISQLRDDISRLTNNINTLTTENSQLKTEHIEVERKSEQFNSLVKTNEDLNTKVNELSATLERIYAETNNPTVIKRKDSNHQDNKVTIETTNRPLEVKDKEMSTTEINGTAKYHFGITSKPVISKLVSFIDELFKNSTKSEDKSFTILSNLKQAKERIGLTDKEYDVFISRLQEMEGPNGMPLLIIVDNKARSYFDKDWMIQYVSSTIA
jgi:chromosome segregation ATPase